MKTRMFVTVLMLGLLLVSAVSAQALTYEATLTPSATLNSSNPFWLGTFTKPAGPFTSATLDLALSNVEGTSVGLFGAINLPPSGFGTTDKDYLFYSTFTSGSNTFTFDATAIQKLNAAISSSGVPIGLYLTNGSVTLNSAKLSGTVAPEPVSMALVAAGLVGLPFVRRFRNTLH